MIGGRRGPRARPSARRETEYAPGVRASSLVVPLVLASLTLAACERDPIVVSRTVTVHVPTACAMGEKRYGVYYAWGDFTPTIDNPAQSKLFLDAGAPLTELPADTRALVLDASDLGSGGRWRGRTNVAASGDVDLLLWPSGDRCSLTQSTEGGTDRLLGVMDDGRVLVTAGKRADNSVASSFVIDLARGVVSPVALGLLNPRRLARVDAFNDGVVVSGGINLDNTDPVANAEVFDGKSNLFDRRQIIPLSIPRSEHGSVRLANGDVLLVGGVGKTGGVLNAMERIDAKLGQSTRDGLPTLTPRRQPIVIRLASGEIMVAGGLDGSDQPVGQVEFLTADATKLRPTTATLPARPRMDCAPTDGGGAVCVIVPLSTDPPSFPNTWIISADRGAVKAQNQLPDPPLLARLLAAADGQPVLWTSEQFLRWDPWSEAFTAEVDVLGGTSEPDIPLFGQPLITADPGLLLWLDPGGKVFGRRFSVRTDYTSDPGAYAIGTLDHLAPDRSPLSSLMKFSGTDGLDLPQDASVFVSDLRFRDFTLDVDLTAGGALRLVLRRSAGDVECTLPGIGETTIHVERRGSTVTASAGGTARPCLDVPLGERVGIGLRGGSSGGQNDRVRNIRLFR